MTRSTTESKYAPRWLDEFDALAKRPVEQIGQGRQHDQQQAEPEIAEADGDCRADGDDETDDGEMVGRESRLSQHVADRLDSTIDRRTELSVEH